MVNKETTLYTIDAHEKKIGRVASHVSTLLMGKNKSSYTRNIPALVKVNVINAAQLSIDSEKLKSKEYIRYTGYPGGLRKESLGALVKRRGYKEALRRAVYGMLPSNKLRNIRMKNLFIAD